MSLSGLSSSISWTLWPGCRDQVILHVSEVASTLCYQCFLTYIAFVPFFLSPLGKMNLMVWGKQCWVSHPDSTFPLPNILHAVLSKTLLWVNSTHFYLGFIVRFPVFLWIWTSSIQPYWLFVLSQHCPRSCPLCVWKLGCCRPPGLRAPTRRPDWDHLDCWRSAGLQGKGRVVKYCASLLLKFFCLIVSRVVVIRKGWSTRGVI